MIKRKKEMIIDSHVHIGATEKLKGRHVTLDTYSDLMQLAGVEKAVIMPNVSDIISSSKLNDDLIADYKIHKNKENFYPFLLVDPRDTQTWDQVSEYFDIIYGIKYHPSVSDCELTDSKMEKFLSITKAYKLPMLVHCGRYWKSYIDYLLIVAKNNPEIIFIAAHLGGTAIQLARKSINKLVAANLDNVYMDTSAIKQPWLIKRAVKNLGASKIIFGSDEPYADLRINKKCVEYANISDKAKERIFYKNFKEVIGE
jgi:predicted TIM-barrel fold metal-dependent hydrolase